MLCDFMPLLQDVYCDIKTDWGCNENDALASLGESKSLRDLTYVCEGWLSNPYPHLQIDLLSSAQQLTNVTLMNCTAHGIDIALQRLTHLKDLCLQDVKIPSGTQFFSRSLEVLNIISEIPDVFSMNEVSPSDLPSLKALHAGTFNLHNCYNSEEDLQKILTLMDGLFKFDDVLVLQSVEEGDLMFIGSVIWSHDFKSSLFSALSKPPYVNALSRVHNLSIEDIQLDSECILHAFYSVFSGVKHLKLDDRSYVDTKNGIFNLVSNLRHLVRLDLCVTCSFPQDIIRSLLFVCQHEGRSFTLRFVEPKDVIRVQLESTLIQWNAIRDAFTEPIVTMTIEQ